MKYLAVFSLLILLQVNFISCWYPGHQYQNFGSEDENYYQDVEEDYQDYNSINEINNHISEEDSPEYVPHQEYNPEEESAEYVPHQEYNSEEDSPEYVPHQEYNPEEESAEYVPHQEYNPEEEEDNYEDNHLNPMGENVQYYPAVYHPEETVYNNENDYNSNNDYDQDDVQNVEKYALGQSEQSQQKLSSPNKAIEKYQNNLPRDEQYMRYAPNFNTYISDEDAKNFQQVATVRRRRSLRKRKRATM